MTTNDTCRHEHITECRHRGMRRCEDCGKLFPKLDIYGSIRTYADIWQAVADTDAAPDGNESEEAE